MRRTTKRLVSEPNAQSIPKKPEPLSYRGAGLLHAGNELVEQFQTILRETDPGKLYLAAALFAETEPRKAASFYYLGDVASRAYYAGTQKWPFKPAQLSYLLRDAIDKAEHHTLRGLCDVLRALFRAAIPYDLLKLERNAAIERGRFALWRDECRKDDKLRPLVHEDCGEFGYGFWWTEANDREVRKRL